MLSEIAGFFSVAPGLLLRVLQEQIHFRGFNSPLATRRMPSRCKRRPSTWPSLPEACGNPGHHGPPKRLSPCHGPGPVQRRPPSRGLPHGAHVLPVHLPSAEAVSADALQKASPPLSADMSMTETERAGSILTPHHPGKPVLFLCFEIRMSSALKRPLPSNRRRAGELEADSDLNTQPSTHPQMSKP